MRLLFSPLPIVFIIPLLVIGCKEVSKSHYPQEAGLTWVYQIWSKSPLGNANLRMVVANQPEREVKGKKAIPQKIELNQKNEFQFIVGDSQGVYVYATQKAGSVEPSVLSPPNYLLKYPIQAGATWDGRETTILTAGKITIRTKTIVETLDATVTVPIGTYQHCIKTKLGGEAQERDPVFGIMKMTLEEYKWLCPGVGLVKSIRKEKGSNILLGSGEAGLELMSFKQN